MKQCLKCGKENEDFVVFCPKCGCNGFKETDLDATVPFGYEGDVDSTVQFAQEQDNTIVIENPYEETNHFSEETEMYANVFNSKVAKITNTNPDEKSEVAVGIGFVIFVLAIAFFIIIVGNCS